MPSGGADARRGLAPFPRGTDMPHKWPGRARKGYRSTGPRPNRLASPCFGEVSGRGGPVRFPGLPGGRAGYRTPTPRPRWPVSPEGRALELV